MSNPWETLADMFEADRKMPSREWYKLFPAYCLNGVELDTPPHWACLSEVWREQGRHPASYVDNGGWEAAWRHVQDLHQKYERHKAKRLRDSQGKPLRSHQITNMRKVLVDQ